MTTRAVMFDLDDTLYAERAFAISGFRAVALRFADTVGDPERAARRMGELFDTGHRGRVFNRLLEESRIEPDDQLIARMIKAYHEHNPSIDLFPDADAALTRLRDRFKLGVITDGPAAMQSAKVGALGLANRVDRIILTDELGDGMGKPHPRAFERIADDLNVPHAACMYVADNAAKDFIAPNALGWRTVQVVRPTGIYKDKPPAPGGHPQCRIATLADLDLT